MAEAASGKKKEKAAPAEKSGGTRLGAKVERARGETAYGFLVNVFRAYYLLVLPYTIAVPLLFDVAFSSFLFFSFFGFYFLFFFFTIPSDIRLNASSYFPSNCIF